MATTRRTRIRVIRTIATLYGAGYLVTLLALEARMLADEGPMAWLLGGFLIPVVQALLWPVLLLGALTS